MINIKKPPPQVERFAVCAIFRNGDYLRDAHGDIMTWRGKKSPFAKAGDEIVIMEMEEVVLRKLTPVTSYIAKAVGPDECGNCGELIEICDASELVQCGKCGWVNQIIDGVVVDATPF